MTPAAGASERVTGPRTAPPQFSKGGGIYTDEFAVELTSPAAGAKVYFTLDGSEPTTASRAYADPVAIDSTTLLRAKCFEPGLAPSLTVSQAYTMAEPGLAGFGSNLPLVIINTFGQQVNKERPISAWLRVVDAGKKRSALSGAGDFDGICELKLRGFSSLRFPKNSFTVKTRNDAGQSVEAPILGLPKDSDWVLYAPYSDKSLIRDVLAYELSNQMGRYAARTRFVEVFVNRHGGTLGRRDYVGVYVFEEKIKRSDDRVKIEKLTPEDNAEPKISGGYIVKRDHTSQPMDNRFGFFNPNQFGQPPEEGGFTTSRGLRLFYVEPSESQITSAQRAWLTRYFNQFEKALNGPNFTSPTDGYAKYLDVDSFIDQFWIVELSKNIDAFRYSCYITKDRGGKLRLEPIWDWNLSFGNANYHQGWMPEQWYWRLLRDNEVSWFRQLSQDPEFMQRVVDRWAVLRHSILSPERILARIDEFAAQLDEAQKRNFKRWPILGQSVNPNWFVGESFQDEINWMKSWIQERIAWIDAQFVAPPALAQGNPGGSTSAKLSFQPADGEIYYTLDGSDPRKPGGGVSSTAKQYTQPFSLKPKARLFARTREGEAWSGPKRIPPP